MVYMIEYLVWSNRQYWLKQYPQLFIWLNNFSFSLFKFIIKSIVLSIEVLTKIIPSIVWILVPEVCLNVS